MSSLDSANDPSTHVRLPEPADQSRDPVELGANVSDASSAL
jgi:hypothetical protein